MIRKFPAKLLLFGEHILLTGASALAVPVPAYHAYWTRFPKMMGKQKRLMEFVQSKALASVQGLDTEALKRDVEQGLVLDSNIPVGYGLGSSGALCAATYERYCREKTDDLSALKSIFARMEGFFHGNSSGIDPLTSYLGQPVLISNKTEARLAVSRPWTEPPVIFLLDSALPRRTGPLVEWFLERARDPIFFETLKTVLLPAHENMVHGWLNAQSRQFWPALRRVSKFQFEYMPPMIPDTVRDAWARSLKKNDLALKICGAGGGGFVLGFARSRFATAELAQQFNLIFPFESSFTVSQLVG